MLRRSSIALFEVHGVYVVYANYRQQKHTDILGIYLVPLQYLESFVDESSLQVVLSLFLKPHEPHFLQNLVEKHVLYLGLRGGRDVQSLNDSEVLFDELLCNVLLVVEVDLSFLLGWHAAVGGFDLPRLLLPAEGITVEQVINWRFPGQLF